MHIYGTWVYMIRAKNTEKTYDTWHTAVHMILHTSTSYLEYIAKYGTPVPQAITVLSKHTQTTETKRKTQQ